MNKETHKKNIRAKMEEIISLQKSHLKQMKNNDFSGIAQMKNERAMAFMNLKHHFSNFQNEQEATENSTNSEDMDLLMELPSVISELDDRLKDEIIRYRTHLAGSLSHIKQGKNALAGYKNVNCTNHRKPHVLSMNR